MVKLYSVIKVNQRGLLKTWQGLPVTCLVVRLQDLVTPRTFRFNKTFYEIKEKGSIHKFLGFDGKIILSLVMRDEIISKFNEVMYSKAINTLMPDFYTTPDGETYDCEEEISWREIKRCIIETSKLIKLCPNSIPLGHVKGCTKTQILTHIRYLKVMGIHDYIFHTGDFFRHGNNIYIQKAKSFVSLIRPYARTLILHGMGSQRRIQEFSFADAYISLNHLVQALRGRRYVGTRTESYEGGFCPEIVRHNLSEMLKNIRKANQQKKLFDGGVFLWEVDQGLVDPAMLEAELEAVIQAV